MRYVALATDYDGTLAHDGVVAASTIEALRTLRASDRKVLLVSGRQLEDLKTVFDHLELFDLAVLENGGLLYRPSDGAAMLLAEAPPEELLERLRQLDVPFFVGHSIVATWEPHQTAALEAIKQLGLELQLIFNKGSVMILPSGVNKATGLAKALETLDIQPYGVVGIGDAENDHAFLAACAMGVAVDNALPMLKERADFVTSGARGAGVEELIARLLADDLRSWEARGRHREDVQAPIGRGAVP
jgi:hydroxymethylpyrimidine pyrophosphatase-like HAD family hydrolase